MKSRYNEVMFRSFAGTFLVLALCLLPSFSFAGDDLPGVDFSGLSAAQKTAAVKLLNSRECGCACGMKVAECRVKDQGCAYSKGLAKVIVDAIRSGKTADEALAAAAASPYAHMPQRDTRPLGDPVQIPTSGAPTLGPANATVKLVEFSDFQCPYCILATPQIEMILKAYPNDVSLTFKQFPLDFHSQAALAARAALAAGKQGRFWPMHDSLFAQRGHLSPAIIDQLAGQIGLSLIRFQADLASPDLVKTVQKDLDDGEKAGVTGTPALFINGRLLNLQITAATLKPMIDAALKPAAANTTTAQKN